MPDEIAQKTPQDPALAISPTRKSELGRLRLAQKTIESGLSLDEVFHEACRIAADVLSVSRVGVWVLLEQGEALRCAALYHAATDEFTEGAVLQISDFPIYFAALKQRKILPSEMAQFDPLTSELVDSYLKPLNITSMLDAPILVAGEVGGVLCCEHQGVAREWTTEDRDFVASIADLLAMKIRVAEVYQLRGLLQLTEERILLTEKSEALAKMALGIAHDFRNILTAIRNCAEALKGAKNLELVQSASEMILQATTRGTDYVRDLAEFGKGAPSHPTILDLGEELKSFVTVLTAALGRDHRLDLQLQSRIGKVMLDRNLFQRVILNLVVNAKEAMPNGGTIDLRVFRWNSNRENSDRVAVEIRDHGCGMDEDTKRQLFDPFFTTKPNGSGLGMPIVQRVVERAGGIIEVHTEVNRGTTIRLLLPVVS